MNEWEWRKCLVQGHARRIEVGEMVQIPKVHIHGLGICSSPHISPALRRLRHVILETRWLARQANKWAADSNERLYLSIEDRTQSRETSDINIWLMQAHGHKCAYTHMDKCACAMPTWLNTHNTLAHVCVRPCVPVHMRLRPPPITHTQGRGVGGDNELRGEAGLWMKFSNQWCDFFTFLLSALSGGLEAQPYKSGYPSCCAGCMIPLSFPEFSLELNSTNVWQASSSGI